MPAASGALEPGSATDGAAAVGGASPGEREADTPSATVVSPAVGVFVYGEGLGPGMAVNGGDPLGHVEMLGVRYDVRAPAAGRVSHLVAETGEAVEYGQVLIELETAASA